MHICFKNKYMQKKNFMHIHMRVYAYLLKTTCTDTFIFNVRIEKNYNIRKHNISQVLTYQLM